MVVSGITNNSSYFSADFPDITIRNLNGDLRFTLTISGNNELEEIYTKDASGTIIIHSLSKLLEGYFSLPAFSRSVVNTILKPLTVICQFQDNSGSSSFSMAIYYSRCSTNVFPGESKLFLSRYKNIRTTAERLEFISFYRAENTMLKIGVAYISNGKERYKEVQVVLPADVNCIVSRLVSLSRIASDTGINKDAVIFYDLYLTNDTLSDRVRYTVDKRQYRIVTNFWYYNAFGLPESISFTGILIYKPELEGELCKLLNETVRTDPFLTDVKTVNSGFVSKDKYEAIVDMLTSPVQQVYDSDSNMNIVFSEIDLEHRCPSNEPINVNMTYYPSDRKYAAFKRTTAYPTGIFDKTFDKTFD